MSFLEKALMEGYAASEITISTIFVCILLTSVVGGYICLVYKLVNRNSFYNRSFHLSLFALAVVTAAIILTIQSNIVVSLGMVGALSIVRFRTAIKDPMDLVFLFWSISAGIICGAGYALIAVIASVVLTIGIIVFSVLPSEKDTMVLVVNSNSFNEKEVLTAVERFCRTWKVRARNITRNNINMAIEVKTNAPEKLVETLCGINHVTAVSLVEHDGDVTA